MGRRKHQQGQSEATKVKRVAISSVLTINMKIISQSLRRKPWANFRYWHFDANCGCGWNEHVDVAGSPLLFHQAADRCLGNIRRLGVFCDKSEGATDKLYDILYARNPLYLNETGLYEGDNEEGIKLFCDRIRREEKPEYAMGSILIDPNGYAGYWPKDRKMQEVPPLKMLNAVNREFPRIDFILNLNLTLYHRMAGHKRKGTSFLDMLSPRELFTSLGKQYWQVKRVNCKGGKWLLAVGRNYRAGDYSALKLYHLDTVEGQAILDQAEAIKEKKVQQQLQTESEEKQDDEHSAAITTD